MKDEILLYLDRRDRDIGRDSALFAMGLQYEVSSMREFIVSLEDGTSPKSAEPKTTIPAIANVNQPKPKLVLRQGLIFMAEQVFDYMGRVDRAMTKKQIFEGLRSRGADVTQRGVYEILDAGIEQKIFQKDSLNRYWVPL